MPEDIPNYLGALLAPQPSNLSSALSLYIESLAKNPRDRVYKNERIVLDGYTFTNCCFNGCKLVTHSGLFVLKSCLVMPNCTFSYGPNAFRILKLWHIFAVNSTWPEFNPAREGDGSITIE